MLCTDKHQQENLILIDSSNNEDDNDEEKTNNSFKLKLSSSSLSSSISSNISSTSRVSTRQSMKTHASNNQQQDLKSSSSSTTIATTVATSDTSSDIIIETQDDVKKTTTEGRKCLWHRCNFNTPNDGEFMDHIQSKHVYSQKTSKKFRCLWKGCRVYKSQSSSFNWLERHVITHVDTRPFLCIINGCKRKFPTQTSLERHVNTHMKVYESPSKQQKLLNQQISTTSSSDSIKNAPINGSSHLHQSKSSSNLTAGRKRKLIEASKYLKKAKYKDYVDEFACKFVEQHLINMSFSNGMIKFRANVSFECFLKGVVLCFYYVLCVI
jgi:hypothetical protein